MALSPCYRVCAVSLLLLSALAAQPSASLRGIVTDPSGAAVPQAIVQLRGANGELRAATDTRGEYFFPDLPRGKYQLRIAARGFSLVEKKDYIIDRARSFDVRLSIHTQTQVINVEDALGRVSPEPESNAGAVIMRERQIAALSDDPDELALQLQALAGPAPGPNGGQMFIDGFSGGNLPPKSAIREVRINSNPFSPEYDRPGFARIDIFTKPGSDTFHGQAFGQFNDQYLNSRNPLLAQSSRPPYRVRMFGLSLGGPIRRRKASFTLDLDRRGIDENAFILATTVDARGNLSTINQALATPQSRTSIIPRIDLALGPRNTLTVRYQELRTRFDNMGVGDFNLASRAYRETQTDRTAQITETVTISPRLVSETRVQYFRSVRQDAAAGAAPAIDVQGAFFDGGAAVGNSASTTNNGEWNNLTSFVRGHHTFKWGGRLRQTRVDDISLNNFAGTFIFFTLAQYQRTLALQQAGYSVSQIAQMGAGPAQFTRNAGNPETRIVQTDDGLFMGDDWRVRSNLTLSYGLRYEVQTNYGGPGNWAPRIGLAWGLDAKGGKPATTIIRAGWGVFYDRIQASVALAAQRFNGVTQQSYFIANPTFFPDVPAISVLEAGAQPQQLRPVMQGIRAPRMYQASLGIERQINPSTKFSLSWIGSRGIHLLDVRNVNTPIQSLYPFGDRSVRLLTESAGISRQNQVVVNINGAFRKVVLFGNYALSYGRDDNEGLPADPYNRRGEWGPSSYGDVRHRLVLGSSVPLPFGFAVSPFLAANSGMPYNITTGLDPLNTGAPTARPGTPMVERNSGRGPGAVNLVLRLARTWSFGGEGSAVSHGGDAGGHGQSGPPAGMFDVRSGRRYNLTLSAFTLNSLNHPNYAPPDGDQSSPYFGQYRSLGGMIVMSHGGSASTYNRKIDLELRFSW